MARTKADKAKPPHPPVVVRLEIAIEATDPPDRLSRDPEFTRRVYEVATHRPQESRITIADAFETAGLKVIDVSRHHIGVDTPSSDVIADLGARWYHEEIVAIARSILSDLTSEPSWRTSASSARNDALHDAIHERVDDHPWVMYTAKARMVNAFSNSPHAWEDAGFENPTDEQRAYCAMEADVRDAIGRLHAEYAVDDEESDED